MTLTEVQIERKIEELRSQYSAAFQHREALNGEAFQSDQLEEKVEEYVSSWRQTFPSLRTGKAFLKKVEMPWGIESRRYVPIFVSAREYAIAALNKSG